jgi:hypothetical protein
VPNVEDHDLAGLEEERTRLHEELVGVGPAGGQEL